MLGSATGLLLGQAVLPYTFTTAELEALKTKLMSAEQTINNTGKGQHTVLQISLSEIKTLLRMIDMTYLQGLSASNFLPTQLPTALPSQLNTQTTTVTPPGPSGQPPAHYVCHKCGIPGHYVQDCTMAGNRGGQTQQQGPRNNRGNPPANYICHKCNKPGHWIQDCPNRQGGGSLGGNMGSVGGSNQMQSNNLQQNRYGQQKAQIDYNKPPPANYICHRCHVAGHWIKNCPTNGDPNFDKNPPSLPQSTTAMSSAANLTGGNASSNVDSATEPPAAKKRKGLNGAAIQ